MHTHAHTHVHMHISGVDETTLGGHLPHEEAWAQAIASTTTTASASLAAAAAAALLLRRLLPLGSEALNYNWALGAPQGQVLK